MTARCQEAPPVRSTVTIAIRFHFNADLAVSSINPAGIAI
jgi:hypothetical protein